jgi:hypothetical protein
VVVVVVVVVVVLVVVVVVGIGSASPSASPPLRRRVLSRCSDFLEALRAEEVLSLKLELRAGSRRFCCCPHC